MAAPTSSKLNPNRGDEVKTAGPIHNPNQINLGSWFFYEDAPAVVQEASYNIRPPCNSFRMPKCISDEISDTGSVEHALDEVRCGQPDPVNERAEWLGKSLLPSELWMLEKEVLAWKDLSTVSSSFPLVKAVLNLKNIDKNKVTDWLLINSPSYGIVLDSTLAQQVFVLLRLLFHVACKEALNSIKSDLQKHVMECTSPAHLTRKSESIHIFFHECLSWLLCILCILYHPPQARALVLELVKFCVILSAQALCYTSGKIHRSNQEDLNLEKRTNDIICAESKIEFMETKRLKSWQVDAAIAALLERAYLEDYVNGCIHTNRMSKANLISEYEAFLQRASIQRNLQPNYRAVLEHDSLIWHSQQQEGSKKHKTKEELLAEERDYKRRRMSYRGKKIRRTPTQVLHDIIDSHMGKIVAAGGIGCFGYQKNSIESVAEVSIASEDVPGKSHCESVTRSPQRQHDRYSKVSGGEKSRPIAGERNTRYEDKEDRKGFREAKRHGDREDRKASREDKYGHWYDDKDGAYNTGYDIHYKSSGHDKQALHGYEHRSKHSEKTREQRKAHANRDFSDRSGVKTEDGKHRKYEDYDHSR